MEVPTPKITEGLSQKKRKIGRNESRNWKGLNQTRNKTKQNNNNNKKQEKQNKKNGKKRLIQISREIGIKIRRSY